MQKKLQKQTKIQPNSIVFCMYGVYNILYTKNALIQLLRKEKTGGIEMIKHLGLKAYGKINLGLDVVGRGKTGTMKCG